MIVTGSSSPPAGTVYVKPVPSNGCRAPFTAKPRNGRLCANVAVTDTVVPGAGSTVTDAGEMPSPDTISAFATFLYAPTVNVPSPEKSGTTPSSDIVASRYAAASRAATYDPYPTAGDVGRRRKSPFTASTNSTKPLPDL